MLRYKNVTLWKCHNIKITIYLLGTEHLSGSFGGVEFVDSIAFDLLLRVCWGLTVDLINSFLTEFGPDGSRPLSLSTGDAASTIHIATGHGCCIQSLRIEIFVVFDDGLSLEK